MRTLVSLMFALALLATACGSAESATSVATGDDGPESFEDLDFNSPLGDFLGFNFDASDDMEAQYAEMERVAGRLTQECMAELGFEYIPPDNSNNFFFGPGSDELPYFSDEWVDKYGFGISTQRFPQSMVGELVGMDFDIGPDSGYVDPNEEYVSSLSEGEAEVYYEALHGEPFDFGPEGPPDDFDFEPRGCEGTSFDQAFSDGPGGNIDEFFNTFGDEMDAMEARAEADPRFVEFNDRVTSCVSDAGLLWIDQEELYGRWESQLNQLEPRGPQGDPFEGTGLDPEQMSDREIDEFFADLFKLDAGQIAQLAEIQAEEIALAKTVIGCGGGPLNEQVILGEVRAEYEQQFLDENADALQEFKAE